MDEKEKKMMVKMMFGSKDPDWEKEKQLELRKLRAKGLKNFFATIELFLFRLWKKLKPTLKPNGGEEKVLFEQDFPGDKSDESDFLSPHLIIGEDEGSRRNVWLRRNH